MLLNTSVHRRGERNVREEVICVFNATVTMPRSFSRRCAGRFTVEVRVLPTLGGIPARTPLNYKEAKKSRNVRDAIRRISIPKSDYWRRALRVLPPLVFALDERPKGDTSCNRRSNEKLVGTRISSVRGVERRTIQSIHWQ
jgi:hypothetical protein